MGSGRPPKNSPRADFPLEKSLSGRPVRTGVGQMGQSPPLLSPSPVTWGSRAIPAPPLAHSETTCPRNRLSSVAELSPRKPRDSKSLWLYRSSIPCADTRPQLRAPPRSSQLHPPSREARPHPYWLLLCSPPCSHTWVLLRAPGCSALQSL